MKILLINPPRKNEIIGNNPRIIEETRGVNPPLGILYIAAYLEKHTTHSVKVIDAQVENLDYEALGSRIADETPQIVGITAMTMTMIDVLKTVRQVKNVNPEIKVVLGGPHAILFPEETIELPGVDFLVIGEGEIVFTKLIEALDNQSAFYDIPGIVYKKNGEIIHTGIPAFIEDLDALPFPARHLTPYDKYNSLLSKGKVATTIFTSRGCPFKCTFCDRPSLGKKFRARSTMNVVDELENCVNKGISDFLVYDDTFTVQRRRVIDICNEICKRGLDIAWDIRARVDTVDETVLAHLKKAGCHGIHYGIEAGTEKILKKLNKGIQLQQAITVFHLTKKYRMSTLAYFMIGNPDETMDDILSTFNFMKVLKADYVHLTILTPFPGTKIYLDGLKNGIIKKDYWREFAKNPTADFQPPHWDEIFSKEALSELLVKGYKSFYLRPSYIARKILSVHSAHEFRKKAAAGLKLLQW
ncbi:MAG: radical SAM protein [Desulfobacterales bacterium]